MQRPSPQKQFLNCDRKKGELSASGAISLVILRP